MAKEGKNTEVTGGITKPSVMDGLSFEPLAEPEARQQAPVRRTGKNQLVAGYDSRRMEEPERRSVKQNILITPYIAGRMDEAAKKGEIKSRNDLINYLLEEYFKNK